MHWTPNRFNQPAVLMTVAVAILQTLPLLVLHAGWSVSGCSAGEALWSSSSAIIPTIKRKFHIYCTVIMTHRHTHTILLSHSLSITIAPHSSVTLYNSHLDLLFSITNFLHFFPPSCQYRLLSYVNDNEDRKDTSQWKYTTVISFSTTTTPCYVYLQHRNNNK